MVIITQRKKLKFFVKGFIDTIANKYNRLSVNTQNINSYSS